MKTKQKIEALKKLREQVEGSACFTGICIAIWDSFPHNSPGLDNSREQLFLEKLIKKEKKKRGEDAEGYLWPMGKKKPRLKWINKKIRKYERKLGRETLKQQWYKAVLVGQSNRSGIAGQSNVCGAPSRQSIEIELHCKTNQEQKRMEKIEDAMGTLKKLGMYNTGVSGCLRTGETIWHYRIDY